MAGITAAFVLEQHLGHRTYADNLRAAFPDRDDFTAVWVPVHYAANGRISSRAPLPGSVRAALHGRSEVVAGLDSSAADVHVFNTQVPAALGGRRSRSRPYVIVTDVTPVQYDQIADGYGHRPDRPGVLRQLKHEANRRVFTRASRCVGWSRWAADSMITDYGVDPSRVEVIPPGVDTTRWSPLVRNRQDTMRVLFVGGEFDRKGGRVLLEAFERLPSRVELFVVTKSEIRDAERVHVIDDLVPNDPRLIDLYRSSDVFVLPSLAETFGIAAVEASAVGLPVVASATGALPEIVSDGETGFLVQPGDVAGLADALLRLEADDVLRNRLGRGGRRRAVERFDAAMNAGRLFDLVLQVARE